MRKTLRTFTVLFPLFSLAHAATFHITQTLGAGHFFLDFGLVDGGSNGVTNSTVTISNLAVADGAFGSLLPDIGGVTDLPNGFRLSDGPDFLSDRAIAVDTMSAGSRISYDLSFSSTAQFSTEPDYFAYRLLDDSLDAVVTTGFANELVAVQLGKGGDSNPQRYEKIDPREEFAGVQTAVVTAVPEPVSYWTLGLGAAFVLRRRCRRV